MEAENLKTQATREEDYERAAYFRDQIAKYKEMQQQTINEDDIPVITEKTIEAIVEEKLTFLLVIWKKGTITIN